jgi:hypothetical protein
VKTPTLSILAAAALLAAPLAAHAQQAGVVPAPAPHATVSLQGNPEAWIKDPHVHAFYDLTKTAFANGPDKIDLATYDKQSMAIFYDFGETMIGKGGGAHMQDHLKLIPGQMVKIVREDPTVLASYDNFVLAIFGPP